MKRILLCGLLILAGPLQAAEIMEVCVEHHDRKFRLYLYARLQASAEHTETIITDYAHLTAINPFLRESRVEERDAQNRTLVHLVTESCVLIFCFELRHDQRFNPIRDGVLVADIVPEGSDFKSGRLTWTVRPDRTGSGLVMETEVEPDFIVPPMIGPYLMEKKLREIALSTVENIERAAVLLAND